MFQAFVYRLYPSKSQRGRLEAVRETCRHFYNDLPREQGRLRGTGRDDHQDRAASQGQGGESHQPLRAGHPQPHPSERRGRSGQGVPGVLSQGQGRRESRLPPVQGQEPIRGVRLQGVRQRLQGGPTQDAGEGRRLYLSGIGRIAVRWHRGIEGTIKTARVFCRAGKWFVAFACEVEKPEPLPETGESIGIDLGLLRLATFSNGEKEENPRWYRKILRELRVLQRKIARCMPGGRNRRRLIRDCNA